MDLLLRFEKSEADSSNNIKKCEKDFLLTGLKNSI